MIVLESMACGRPVVATDVGGLREALGPFADDWLVGDDRQLVDRMRQAVAQPADPVPLRAYAESRAWPARARVLETAMDTWS